MSKFPEIILKQVSESYNLYELTEPCEYKALLTIPTGFVTDFASVPRFLWWWIAPHTNVMPASVLHDYFYVTHPMADVMNMTEERHFADKLFHLILLESGVSKFQAGAMYKAVRWFGKYRFEHFGKSRKRVKLDKKRKK